MAERKKNNTNNWQSNVSSPRNWWLLSIGLIMVVLFPMFYYFVTVSWNLADNYRIILNSYDDNGKIFRITLPDNKQSLTIVFDSANSPKTFSWTTDDEVAISEKELIEQCGITKYNNCDDLYNEMDHNHNSNDSGTEVKFESWQKKTEKLSLLYVRAKAEKKIGDKEQKKKEAESQINLTATAGNNELTFSRKGSKDKTAIFIYLINRESYKRQLSITSVKIGDPNEEVITPDKCEYADLSDWGNQYNCAYLRLLFNGKSKIENYSSIRSIVKDFIPTINGKIADYLLILLASMLVILSFLLVPLISAAISIKTTFLKKTFGPLDIACGANAYNDWKKMFELIAVLGPAIGFMLTTSALIQSFGVSFGSGKMEHFVQSLQLALVSTFLGLLVRIFAELNAHFLERAIEVNRLDKNFSAMQSYLASEDRIANNETEPTDGEVNS